MKRDGIPRDVDAGALFSCINKDLSGSSWAVSHQCLLLLGEIAPHLHSDRKLPRYVDSLLPNVILNLGSRNGTTSKAALNTLVLLMKYSFSARHVLAALVRAGFGHRDARVRRNSITAVPQLVRAGSQSIDFRPLLDSLAQRLNDENSIVSNAAKGTINALATNHRSVLQLVSRLGYAQQQELKKHMPGLMMKASSAARDARGHERYAGYGSGSRDSTNSNSPGYSPGGHSPGGYSPGAYSPAYSPNRSLPRTPEQQRMPSLDDMGGSGYLGATPERQARRSYLGQQPSSEWSGGAASGRGGGGGFAGGDGKFVCGFIPREVTDQLFVHEYRRRVAAAAQLERTFTERRDLGRVLLASQGRLDRTMQMLLAMMRDRHFRVVLSALACLRLAIRVTGTAVKMHLHAIMPRLVERFADSKPVVRSIMRLIRALFSQCGAGIMLGTLQTYLADDNWVIRLHAVHAIIIGLLACPRDSTVSYTEVVNTVALALDDPAEKVRLSAVECLAVLRRTIGPTKLHAALKPIASTSNMRTLEARFADGRIPQLSDATLTFPYAGTARDPSVLPPPSSRGHGPLDRGGGGSVRVGSPIHSSPGSAGGALAHSPTHRRSPMRSGPSSPEVSVPGSPASRASTSVPQSNGGLGGLPPRHGKGAAALELPSPKMESAPATRREVRVDIDLANRSGAAGGAGGRVQSATPTRSLRHIRNKMAGLKKRMMMRRGSSARVGGRRRSLSQGVVAASSTVASSPTSEGGGQIPSRGARALSDHRHTITDLRAAREEAEAARAQGRRGVVFEAFASPVSERTVSADDNSSEVSTQSPAFSATVPRATPSPGVAEGSEFKLHRSRKRSFLRKKKPVPPRSGDDDDAPHISSLMKRSSLSTSTSRHKSRGDGGSRGVPHHQQEYSSAKDLLPFDDPVAERRAALKGIKAAEWDARFKAMNALRRLAAHHRQVLRPKLKGACESLVRNLASLRSIEAKNATLTFCDLFVHLKKDMDFALTNLMPDLLRRAGEKSSFIKVEASRAMDAMISNCSRSRIMQALLSAWYGGAAGVVKAKGSRESCAEYMSKTMLALGSRLSTFRDLDRVIKTAGLLLIEGSPANRLSGKKMTLNIARVLGNDEAMRSQVRRLLSKTEWTAFDKCLERGEAALDDCVSTGSRLRSGSLSGSGVYSRSSRAVSPELKRTRPEKKIAGKASSRTKRRSTLRLDPQEAENLKSIFSQMSSKSEWRTRVAAIEGLDSMCASKPGTTRRNMVKIVDQLSQRLEDGNSKVNMAALRAVGSLAPHLKHADSQIRMGLFSHLAAHVASANAAVRKVARMTFESLAEALDSSQMVAPLAHTIQFGKVSIRPLMVQKLLPLVSTSSGSLIRKHVVPTAVALLKGKGSADVRDANRRLISALHKAMGDELFSVPAVKRLSRSQHGELMSIVAG